MNQEATDFAAHRFTPRTARSPDSACAVEHFAPPRSPRWHAWAAVCIAATVGIAFILSRGV